MSDFPRFDETVEEKESAKEEEKIKREWNAFLEQGHKSAVVHLYQVEFPDPKTFWTEFFNQNNTKTEDATRSG